MVAEMYQCVFSTERRVDMKPGHAQLTGEQRQPCATSSVISVGLGWLASVVCVLMESW